MELRMDNPPPLKRSVTRSISIQDILQNGRRDIQQAVKNPCEKFKSIMEEGGHLTLQDFQLPNGKIDADRLQMYLSCAKMNGIQPDIRHNEERDERVGSLLIHRERLDEHEHYWTKHIGKRYSRRRGCIQFWVWLVLGLVIAGISAAFIAGISRDDVVHLGDFTGSNQPIGTNFSVLNIEDEVEFYIKYDILGNETTSEFTTFQVLLLSEDEYENYEEGKPFRPFLAGSCNKTHHAILPETHVPNNEKDDYVLVVQPCYQSFNGKINEEIDFCVNITDSLKTLPMKLDSSERIFRDFKGDPRDVVVTLENYIISPDPASCSETIEGFAYLAIFLPWLIVVLFGLRIWHLIFCCRSYEQVMQDKFEKELNIPEEEVDYWQPNPWDRKVPKTRLLGPCCWKKIRRPTEPFYTWWRHENYFSWIFFPYRHERLARSERAIIIFCSLYVTFYVIFFIAMNQDSWLLDKLFAGILLVYILTALLPALAKAIFKEIFKLIYRTRRKFYRHKRHLEEYLEDIEVNDNVVGHIEKQPSLKSLSSNVDIERTEENTSVQTVVNAIRSSTVPAVSHSIKPFSFRYAFLAEILVVVFVTLVQIPLLIVWMTESCAFLIRFIQFWGIALLARLSIVGLIEDFVWYLIIKTFGWRDLCPYCTERLVHCQCFNDRILIIAVAHLGNKWNLIKEMDAILNAEEPQFELYTVEQLQERWEILVQRAKVHMKKVSKLRKTRLKKAKDQNATPEELKRLKKCTAGDDYNTEKLILLLDRDMKSSCPIEKHYDSNFVMAMGALRSSFIMGLDSLLRSKTDRIHENEDLESERDRIYRGIDVGSDRDSASTFLSNDSTDMDDVSLYVNEEPESNADWVEMTDSEEKQNEKKNETNQEHTSINIAEEEKKEESMKQRMKYSYKKVKNWFDHLDS